MAAFLLPQLYGQLTMMSVVEEKSTRVIEVLLSHLRPRTLLMGKVVGIGALAVAQLAVVICGLVTALLVTDAIDVPGAVWRFVPVIVIAIVGGLAIYNTLFALLGSLISRQEDASQVILPVFIPLMAGFFIAQAAIAGSANPTLVRVLTLFPLTAPMLLPIRVALETIEPWEIALSLGLLTLGVWLLIRIAGRVYEFTLLHTGSRVGWGQLLRLSRGSAID
jgi:ABC-2 type transport system permease protein